MNAQRATPCLTVGVAMLVPVPVFKIGEVR